MKSGPQNDPCLDDFTAQRISLAGDCGLGDPGVPQERTFDLEWTDPVASALDHVTGATLKPEVSIGVAARQVSSDDPAVALCFTRRLRLVPIAQPIPVVCLACAPKQTGLTIGEFLAGFVDGCHALAWRGQPHRTPPRAHIGS